MEFFETRKIIEVFAYYDKPVLFSYRLGGEIFLAVLESDDEEFERWLFVMLSKERYKSLENNQIDFHDAFAKCEDGRIGLQTIYRDNRIFDKIDILDIATISNEMLPLSGEYPYK